MMSKKSPQLRFKGFTDDWEDRNLKDILREFSTKSKIENEYRVLSSTNVGMEFRDGRVSGTSNLGYKIIKNGDLVLSPQNLWLGNININNIGTGLVSPSYKTFNFTDIDSSFIKPQLRTPKMLEEYKNSSTQGASVVRRNLEIDSFYQIKIATPSIKEQEKIGSFFKHLDALITLQQRKLDLLKEQKKGYLQKMFPKAGEKIPELRFAGFADDWEERKSKEIFKAKVRKGEPNLPVLSVTQTSGVVYRGELGIDIKYDVSTLKNYKVIEPNDFVISLRSFQGGFELSDKLGITSPAYTIFVPKYPEEQNNLFWRIQFKRFQFIESLKTVTFGIRDGKSISFNEFGDLKIKFPSNILEQQKIGTFFKQLDDTIALHQRKLDLLKEQKKGFLQKMFV
ncbi:restriction endonuclease subunit S [Lactococcus lactis]